MKYTSEYIAIVLTLCNAFSCHTIKPDPYVTPGQLFISISIDYVIIFDLPKNKDRKSKLYYEIKRLPDAGCPPCPRDSILTANGQLDYAMKILRDNIIIRTQKHKQNKIKIDILDRQGKYILSYNYIKSSDDYYYPLGKPRPIDKQAVEDYIKSQTVNNTRIFVEEVFRGCNPRMVKC